MRITFLLQALLLCVFANAQITITDADMPAVGDTFYVSRDLSPAGFSVGAKGANVTWDFSNLQADEQDTTYALAPSATTYAADFPNANLALTNDNVAFLYYRNISSALKGEGFANVDPSLGVVVVNFSPIPDQYQFPATYLTNFAGTSGFVEAKNYNQLPANIQNQIDSAVSAIPGASVNQVRVTFTSSYKDTIDAWGTVITPNGTYDALRRKRIENSNTKIEAEVQLAFPPSTFWQQVSNTNSNTTEHSWLSSLTKLPVVSLGYDAQRVITSVTYSNIAPPPPLPDAGFTWSNTTGGTVVFTDTSHDATTYHWDFGDGDSSQTLGSQQHVYSANGSYWVCLTVTNATGSDMQCDSVHVTNVGVNLPPIAVRDSAYIVYPDSAQLNVLDNDSDPNNDTIFFDLVENPLNGTVVDLNNGNVKYTANANFSGVDSFRYFIHDSGTPTLRDTGWVVIEVQGEVGIAGIQSGNIQLYPNPSTDEVKFETRNLQLTKVEVINLNGKILISQSAKSAGEELIIGIHSLPSGFYICKLTTSDGRVMTGKVVKN